MTKEIATQNSKISEELNLSSLPKGIYFIKADMGEESSTKKIVIE